MTPTPLLAAEGITKQFDGIRALDRVGLEVFAGECVGVIGPNGAGKSTLFDCLTGRLRPDAGRATFRGAPLAGRSGAARARAGLARTFQRVELFAGMTVVDHLLVAMQARAGEARVWRDLLGRGRPRPAEMGRALACDPVLMFLDEPSSGLDRDEGRAMAGVLDDVRAGSGTAILLVEHDVPFVRRLASRLYVLDAGRLLAQGPTDEVLADAGVRAAYLGASA
jgi:branched-chain amino acid transport system ATP-binding protein